LSFAARKYESVAGVREVAERAVDSRCHKIEITDVAMDCDVDLYGGDVKSAGRLR
jgi:hypothetical protein